MMGVTGAARLTSTAGFDASADGCVAARGVDGPVAVLAAAVAGRVELGAERSAPLLAGGCARLEASTCLACLAFSSSRAAAWSATFFCC